MDDRKLLWSLNALVCVLILLHIYTLAGASPSATTNTATATGGSVTSQILVGQDAETKARARGYFSAKEYADFHGVSLETVYRHIESGAIPEAEKVNSRWRLPLN